VEIENNYEHRLTEVEARSKSNTRRLDEVEKRQDNLDQLVSSVAVMAKEQEHIKSDVSEIKSDVRSIIDKPGKRWDSIVEKIVWAVVAAVLGLLLGYFGL
jgi:hypothetical protein